MAQDTKRVFTVDEVAVELRISRATAYEMVRTGKIPSIKLGKRILIPVSELEKLLSTRA
jgi:excisionase family DNA binding protein